MRSLVLGLLALALVAGCDSSSPAPDAAADASPLECPRACDDGTFCNGAERCMPEAAGADEDGCVAGENPCAGRSCMEATDACADACGDADGDGRRDASCGGDDCDDADPLRFTGATEVCDAVDRDEDCDPTTFGVRDLDGDGDPDAACCNVVGAMMRCGTDCDDSRPGVSSTATETCNRLDDDCDGAIDEMGGATLWPDRDGDGYGDASPGAMSMIGCPGTPMFSTMQGDCDDSASSRNVAAPEVCNGIDDDCDDRVDDIRDDTVVCTSGSSAACVTSAGLAGSRRCAADCLGYGTCGAPEVCNGVDDDGDGTPDEDFACVRGATLGCDTACGTRGTGTCTDSCTAGVCRAAEICNFCDDDATNGIAAESTLATTTDAARLISGDAAAMPAIGAPRLSGLATETVSGSSDDLTFLVRLLDGTADSQVGAYWIDLQRYQGWGPTTILAEMRVRSVAGGFPMGGWSVVVATGGTGDLGTAQERGVPATRTGARFDWVWGVPSGSAVESADRAAYGRLDGFTTWRGTIAIGAMAAPIGRPVPSNSFDGQTTTITQSFVIVYQPEDPYTVAIEERVGIAFPRAGAPSCARRSDCGVLGETCVFTLGTTGVCLPTSEYALDGDGNTSDPANDIPVGSRLSIGITAGTYPYTFTPPGSPMEITLGARVISELVLRRVIQPPSGSGGAVITIPRTAITRARVCPGPF